MSKKQYIKSRDNFLLCAARARKHGDKEKEKLFFDLAVSLNNLANLPPQQ
jgi:hypothetical protein